MPGRENGFDRLVRNDTRNEITALVIAAREARAKATAQAENMERFDAFEYARRGNEAALAKFIAAGGNVNCRDEDRCTPLHYGASHGHAGICTQLLAAGARADITNKATLQPLHLAATWGHAKVATLLLQHDTALAAAVDKLGQTAVHKAALEGKVDVLQALVQLLQQQQSTAVAAAESTLAAAAALLTTVAAIDQRDAQQNTPLHLACHSGRKLAVELLCDKGAVLWLRNSKKELAGDAFSPSVPIAVKRGIQLALERARQARPLVAVKPANRASVQRPVSTAVAASSRVSLEQPVKAAQTSPAAAVRRSTSEDDSSGGGDSDSETSETSADKKARAAVAAKQQCCAVS
jgi:ankyrin repeat protein